MNQANDELGRLKCPSCSIGMHEFSEDNNGLGGFLCCPSCTMEWTADYVKGFWHGRDIEQITISVDLKGAVDETMQIIGIRIEERAVKILSEDEIRRLEVKEANLRLWRLLASWQDQAGEILPND